MTTAVAAPEERLSAWDRFLFQPESPSPAALLRIVWGVLATAWALTLLPDIDPFMTRGDLYYGSSSAASYWNPLDLTHSNAAPLIVCLLLVGVGITTTIGLFSRVSAAIAFVCMLSLQRQNPIISNSGDLVLRHIGLAVALAPSGVMLSVDSLRRKRKAKAKGEVLAPPMRAPWAIRFLQIDIAVGYFLSMWPKLRGETWHDGTALGLALRITDVQRFAPPSWLFDQSILLNALTWATLAFEGSFLFLVWKRRWRPWVLGVGIAFHLGIDLFIDVGFFSYAMITTYIAFIPPDVADRIVDRVRGKLRRKGDAPAVATPEAAPAT